MEFTKPATAETPTSIAPLLDVVLLLLIFFMVTTSFAERQLPLDLPGAEAGQARAAEALILSIDAKGTLTVDGERLSYDDVTRLLQTLAAQERNLEIRADAAARHGDVIRVLDLAEQVDLRRIGIAVDPRE